MTKNKKEVEITVYTDSSQKVRRGQHIELLYWEEEERIDEAQNYLKAEQELPF